MPRNYNINLSVSGGDRRGAFGGGNLAKNKNTLNSGMYRNQDDGGVLTTSNLKKVVNLGLAFNTIQKGNEITGAWTQNRLRQRKIDRNLTFAKYAIGIAINPFAGGIYMASDLSYRAIMYGIKKERENIQSRYYQELSGNNSYSGSRYRGDYV